MGSTELSKLIVAMIIMMNPLGSMSIFIQLTSQAGTKEQRQLASTCTIAMITIMILTIWGGKEFLDLSGITIPSFRFAGGIILLFIGLSMLQSKASPIQPSNDDLKTASEMRSVAVVPLALPTIIGPGAISTLIIASNDYPSLMSKLVLSMTCTALALAMGVILYFSTSIAKFLGDALTKAITRIMGMIIMAIAVGMLANGLMGLFPLLNLFS
jgi:multiple antibiotic resistance protein